MRFDGSVTIINGVAAPDPIADPEDVPSALLVNLPERARSSADQLCSRLLLALQAPAAESVTVELWALVEAPERPGRPQDITTAPEDRIFLRFDVGLVLGGRELVEVTASVPVGGIVYVRRTADTLTTARVVVVSCAS